MAALHRLSCSPVTGQDLGSRSASSRNANIWLLTAERAALLKSRSDCGRISAVRTPGIKRIACGNEISISVGSCFQRTKQRVP